MSDYIKLQNRIIELSEAKEWSLAKLEWNFHRLYTQSGSKCLCEHPITNVCQIINSKNSKILEVGNECINQFDEKLDSIGLELFKLYGDLLINTPKKLAEFALKQGIITEYEFNFCIDRSRKSKWSEKQTNYKRIINKKIVDAFFFIECPSCKVGKLVQKSSKNGRFMGCSTYPICNHTENNREISQ